MAALLQRYGGQQPGGPWGAASGSMDGSGGGGKWSGLGGGGGGEQPPPFGNAASGFFGRGGMATPLSDNMMRLLNGGGPAPGNMGRSWGGNMVQTGGTSPPPVDNTVTGFHGSGPPPPPPQPMGPTLTEQAQAYMPAGIGAAGGGAESGFRDRLIAALMTRPR